MGRRPFGPPPSGPPPGGLAWPDEPREGVGRSWVEMDQAGIDDEDDESDRDNRHSPAPQSQAQM